MEILRIPTTVPKYLAHVNMTKEKILNIYYMPGYEVYPVETKINNKRFDVL